MFVLQNHEWMKVAAGVGGGLLSALGLLGSNVEAGLFLGAFFASGFFLASHIQSVDRSSGSRYKYIIYIYIYFPYIKIFTNQSISHRQARKLYSFSI